jgi:hypothetical protein
MNTGSIYILLLNKIDAFTKRQRRVMAEQKAANRVCPGPNSFLSREENTNAVYVEGEVTPLHWQPRATPYHVLK